MHIKKKDISSYGGVEVTASTLISEDKGDAAFNNVIELQKYIDQVSNSGGGIVHIPKGTYYFKVDPTNKEKNWATTGHNCHFAIWCRNNVLIEGEGIDETILKPYGIYPHGLNMFHYTTVFNWVPPVYLRNADFKNFTINSDEEQYINPQSSDYKAMGKGFMLAPIKDCDWENVKVMNTDGTGFGVDLPINCTISNCIAIGCGKAATENDVGASGFGIGTGYTNDESMVLDKCISINNKKYGYFFENQTRFGRFKKQPSQASTSEGFVVINCEAEGNLYDFGGARANDVVYENCISKGTPRASTIFFEKHCFNIYFTGINKEKTDSIDKNAKLNNGDSLSILFNYAGMPGKVVKWSNGEVAKKLKSKYSNIRESDVYFDAFEWAADSGIIDSNNITEFKIENLCSRGQFITMLWRYAGKPEAQVLNDFTDVKEDDLYKSAVDWGVSKKIIKTDAKYFKPDELITKGEAYEILENYNNSKNTTFSIKYYLLGGKTEIQNPTTYTSGTDSFTLCNPTKEGYVFAGWTGSIEGEYNTNYVPKENVSISKDDAGNKVYTANWIPIL